MLLKLCFISAMAALLLVTINAGAQESKLDQWPALKSFHTVISQTYHPSESGNLEPIKTRSGELLEKATALSSSAIPDVFNKPGIADAVKELLTRVTTLNKGIKKKKWKDDAIKSQLSAMHDSFHKIIEKCLKDE